MNPARTSHPATARQTLPAAGPAAPRDATAPTSGRIRLLTLNVHKGFSTFNRRFVLHELREAINAVEAHVVCLQEIIGSHSAFAREHPAWPAEPHYQFLASTLWGSYAYGRNAVYSEGHHGNAVLSKYPIARHHNHDISVGSDEPRGLLHCEHTVPGLAQPLHTVCVHLSLKRDQRDQQFERLCRLLDVAVPEAAPLLVAGDFNDWGNRAARALERGAGLREAFTERTGAPARSFPARLPLLRLDRVYFRNLDLHDARVLARRPWSRLSDHAGLCVEFDPRRR